MTTFLEMFPTSLKSNVEAVAALIPETAISPHQSEDALRIHGEAIKIYSRIYSPELSDSAISDLTQTQRTILSCIYTRHHDGFVREKHLKRILADEKPWTVPFVVMLLGEYVVEIIELAESGIERNQAMYKEFIVENPAFWEKTKARMISYWNEYYRKSIKHREDYPAMRIAKIIER